MNKAGNEDTEYRAEKSLDTTILRRLDAHTEKTVEEFVRKNYLDVYRYLYHRVSSAFDAQDLTQDTFLKYVAQVSAAELDSKGRAYLFTIARNISNDFYRTQRPQTQPITPEMEETLPCGMASEEQATDDFDALVATLDASQREILSLRYAQSFGIGEIAEIVGVSRFAVRRTIKRALAELGALLKGSEHAE